jgi:hypothetical protein
VVGVFALLGCDKGSEPEPTQVQEQPVVKAAKGSGEASEKVTMPAEPEWWETTAPKDRVRLIYSTDVFGEIDPCG